MRVLFLESHPMLVNGLPNGFRDAGCEVKISGPLSAENIPLLIAEFQPDLVFTLGWSHQTTHEKALWAHQAVQAARLPLVYWATEDPTHTYSFTLPLIQRLQPDFVFTICRDRVGYYRQLGIPAAHMDFGYHPGVHFKTTPQQPFSCAVGVVANAYPNTLKIYRQHYRIESLKTLVAPLVAQGMRVDFWGRGWERMEDILGAGIPGEWLHGYLEYPLANLVYSSASIMLGLQNHATQLSQRTYEIMGSGGLLLTSDTPEIRRLFTPGEDLIVSSSPEQTVELVKYYLETPDERQRISAQGQKAVAAHAYANRAAEMLRILHEENIIP